MRSGSRDLMGFVNKW